MSRQCCACRSASAMQQEASASTIVRPSMPTQASELQSQAATADHHPRLQTLQCSGHRTQHTELVTQAGLAAERPRCRTLQQSGSITQHSGWQSQPVNTDGDDQPRRRMLDHSGSEHNTAAAKAPNLQRIRTSAACQVAMLNEESCASAPGSHSRRSSARKGQPAGRQNLACLNAEGLTEVWGNSRVQAASAAEFSGLAHGGGADAFGCTSDTIHGGSVTMRGGSDDFGCGSDTLNGGLVTLGGGSETLNGGSDVFSSHRRPQSRAAEGRMVEAQVQQWQEGRTRAQRQAALATLDTLTGETVPPPLHAVPGCTVCSACSVLMVQTACGMSCWWRYHWLRLHCPLMQQSLWLCTSSCCLTHPWTAAMPWL